MLRAVDDAGNVTSSEPLEITIAPAAPEQQAQSASAVLADADTQQLLGLDTDDTTLGLEDPSDPLA